MFDIIIVSETRIKKQTLFPTNINLTNYAIEFTPTETSAGRMLLYIGSHLSYKLHPDPNIYKANQLESIFPQIFNLKKVILLKVVDDCLYKHPTMDVLDFKNNYLSQNLKQLFLRGNLNINLLNNNDNQSAIDFLNSLPSNSFIPYIVHPPKITVKSLYQKFNCYERD